MQTRKGIPNLTVHRNTREERQQRDMRRALMADAKSAGNVEGISGYAIVAWNDEWGFRAGWRKPDKMPSVIMPEFVKGCLERELTRIDVLAIIDSKRDDSG